MVMKRYALGLIATMLLMVGGVIVYLQPFSVADERMMEDRGSATKQSMGQMGEEPGGSASKMQPEEPPESLHEVMEGVLELTLEMMESFAEEGGERMLVEQAAKLADLGKWIKVIGKEKGAPGAYFVYADQFTKYAQALVAQAGDMENAMLYFNQISLACVRCHAAVR